MDEKPGQIEKPDGKTVRINWIDAGPAILANNLTVQRDDNTVYVTFYQITPPLVFGEDEEAKMREFEKIESINALPVAKLAIPVQQLKSFVNALNAHSK